jgi:hypothetical protein
MTGGKTVPTIEQLMIEEAFDNQTHRVIFTPMKADIPCPNWKAVKKDELSWWEVQKESEQIWTDRKIRSQLRLPKTTPVLEGMVFIRIRENGKVKEVIPYTAQAREASRELYRRIFKT